jgi:hypothetical protein
MAIKEWLQDRKSSCFDETVGSAVRRQSDTTAAVVFTARQDCGSRIVTQRQPVEARKKRAVAGV